MADTDAAPNHVALAHDLVRAHQWTNVRVIKGDARATGLPSSSFDIVHAACCCAWAGPDSQQSASEGLVRSAI
jgi:hypothetical protein